MYTTLTRLEHHAAIHSLTFDYQPQGKQLGKIVNDFKRMNHNKLHNIQDVFEAAEQGKCFIPCDYTLDTENKIKFNAASFIAVDIDDDNCITDPIQVLNELKSECTGLFYTFSDGKKGNRYRLIFQFDRDITNLSDYNAVFKYMLDHLKQKGLPVDTDAKNPTNPIRTGNKKAVINRYDVRLSLNEIMPKAREKQRIEIERQTKEFESDYTQLLNNPPTFDDLTNLCKAIGHIPSGQGLRHEWSQAAYSLWHFVELGIITDSEGWDLFNIISGNEASEKDWVGFQNRRNVTIATLFYMAKEKGYELPKSYKHALRPTNETIKSEHIKLNRSRNNQNPKLTKDIAIQIIKRNQKVILDSPTGSGKTYSFMTAFKELANESNYDFYIFAAPTRVLGEQIAKEHNIPYIRGGMNNNKTNVINHIRHGKRVFVSTYDKTHELYSFIADYLHDKDVKYYIAIDEVHKYTEAYNYRYKVIKQLKDLMNVSTSYIGITGTPEDLKKDDYDVLIKVDTGNEKSPCTDFKVITYESEDGYGVIESGNSFLVKFLVKQSQNMKMLLFINNKKRINNIAAELKKEGIKVVTVTSDSKKSATYKQIVETGTIQDDVQVILTTVVLADGISIKNDFNWSCMVVSDSESNIYNPSTIKQISNRFRNQYRYFLLFTRPPKSDSETNRYHIETSYRLKQKISDGYVEYLNASFKDNYQEFSSSLNENEHSIYYDELENIIKNNPLRIRYNAMLSKEKYYQVNKTAFINEIGKLIGHKASSIQNANDELKESGTDVTNLLELERERKVSEMLTKSEKMENFLEYFDDNTYLAIKHLDDETTIKVFKENVHETQYYSALKNANITSFEACKKISYKCDKKAKINSYISDIKTLIDIAYFYNISRNTLTKKIYFSLLQISNKTYEKSDFDDIITNKLRKTIRFNKELPTVKDMKETVKMFDKKSWRSNSVGYNLIQPLSIELVADNQGISKDDVKESILLYIKENVPEKDKNKYLKSTKDMYFN